jgi:carbon monoxide dehydrogenase subunit G
MINHQMIQIRNKNVKKFKLQKDNTKILNTLSIITLIFIAFIGFNIHTVFAEKTDTINKTKIVSTPISKVWNIISNVDKDPDYWSITNIKNINKTDDMVEREVTVPAPPFMNPNAYQIIILNPEKTVIENQTKGPITGTKTITLSQVDSNNANKTAINVLWNLDLSKVPSIGKGFAKDNIEKSVDDALNKIEKALQ